MKNILKLLILSSIFTLTSCEDFLDKIPLDTVSEASFYQNASDLQAAVNGFYNDLPGWASLGVGYNILPDSNTDMGLTEDPSNRLSGLSYDVPSSANASTWSWDEVREVNWLIDHLDQASASSGSEQTLIDQYSGEAYFFRAYYYFELLTRYGDLPIFAEYFDNNDTEYVFAGRDPRNEVVDFMLSDLDKAISLMQSFPEISGHPRISKEVAQLFKARVALYEGTWEKYHNGTPFGVAGSDGTRFLQIAASAAEAVMNSGVFSLHGDYSSLFNQVGLSGNSEVMLWRDFNSVTLGIANVLQKSWPNRCGYTKFAVDSYLAADGLPTAISAVDGSNKDLNTIEIGRDPRLAALIMVPGDVVEVRDGVTTVWEYPNFNDANTGNTGYESQKYRNVNYVAAFNDFTEDTSKIIFRYAEALLIFAEAKAELGTITQTDLNKSINLLRARVNMPGITLGAIVTDPNWPNYGHTLTPIIYEVRRERTVELMAEGFRDDDLYRWRAHTLFDGDQPRGAFYNDGVVNTISITTPVDSDGFLLPFSNFGNYNFDETKAYLNPLPLDELQLNPNLTQNPGWE
ncbi:putative outer membrane starch-binding protein [Mariniflexile fucanivorans]|uniref:Putative outer membrane starch-binding protein n=1 Tax=Mariniflexile fucanivorans TaxID=264023 RepID=A0A4V2QDW7_9FLAO|nr:RagB/SusD family nutrient uptake outer membrane protein [Mariniflexile fucanivorans]TCL65577.1 putative outer membrane starch-binding protein [Mariniflexile fucanivorans]